MQPGDVPITYADTTALEEDFGFKPSTSLRDGLRKFAEWYKEFYINVLLSNLSSLIKNQVDEEIQITAKSTNKYRYQANLTFIIGRIKTIFPKILCNLFDLSTIDSLYKESLQCRSQIMPGRTFRQKKNRAIGRTHLNNKKVSF